MRRVVADPLRLGKKLDYSSPSSDETPSEEVEETVSAGSSSPSSASTTFMGAEDEAAEADASAMACERLRSCLLRYAFR